MIATIIAASTGTLLQRHCQACRGKLRGETVSSLPGPRGGPLRHAFCESCLAYRPYSCRYMLQLTLSRDEANVNVLLFDDNVKGLLACTAERLDAALAVHGAPLLAAITAHLVGWTLDWELRAQCRPTKSPDLPPDLIVEGWEPLDEEEGYQGFATLHPALLVGKGARCAGGGLR